jgi:capsule polysaccharide export protein KpsC/LpsZ
MPRPQLQARFPEDTADAVEEYANEHDVSRSEALRRLVDEGLSARKRKEMREDLEEIKARTDGGPTYEQFESLQDRQERQQRAQTYTMAALAAGLTYLFLYVAGYMTGFISVVVGMVVIIGLAASLAYSYGAGGSHE